MLSKLSQVDIGRTGLAMVLKDEEGDFLTARTLLFYRIMQIHKGDAMAILEALSWFRISRFKKVHVETDLRPMASAIYANKRSHFFASPMSWTVLPSCIDPALMVFYIDVDH
ncbi:hypothetical protein PTKIN_Ptkin03bG0099500 [Pterospermum kingtungense]